MLFKIDHLTLYQCFLTLKNAELKITLTRIRPRPGPKWSICTAAWPRGWCRRGTLTVAQLWEQNDIKRYDLIQN